MMKHTGRPVRKDMMSKFKESFSLKSFSSKSYQTSLICNSKTFQLDVNLIDGFAKPFRSSNLIPNRLKDVPIRIEVTNCHDRNLYYSEGKNKYVESLNFTNKTTKFERTGDVRNNDDSRRSSTGDSQNSSIGDSKNSFTGDLQKYSTVDSKRSCTVESQRYFTKDSRRFSIWDLQRSSIEVSKNSSIVNSQNSSIIALQNSSFKASINFSAETFQNASIGASQNSSIDYSPNSFEAPEISSIRYPQNSTISDSQRSSTRVKKYPLIVSAKQFHKPKHLNSSTPVETKDKQKCSDFKSLQCDVCQKYFSSARNVRRHSSLHSSERHPCEICGKVFRTEENLKRHSKAMHRVKVKSIKCLTCFKAYSSRSALRVHLKKHPDHVLKSAITTDLLLSY